jgi:hypothetical protein
VATSDDAVAVFDEVHVLAPRGRFVVEMHASFLKLVGQVGMLVMATALDCLLSQSLTRSLALR